MNKHKFYIVIFLCLVFIAGTAQNKVKIDSLILFLKSPKQDTLTVYAYCNLASELVGVDNEQAKIYALKGLTISKKIKNKKMLAWANHVVGLSYDYIGIADSAYYFYSKSIELKEALGDVEGIATTNLNIGVLYFYQKEYDRALVYYQKALELYKKTNNEVRVAAALNNIGAIYRVQKKYKNAIEVYKQSLKLKEKANDMAGMSNAMNNLGIVYMYLNQFDTAESFLKRSLEFQKKVNEKNNLINSYLSIANLYVKMEKFDDGRFYLNQAIRSGDSLDMPHEMIEAYKIYTVIDSTTGDFKSAFEHLKLYNETSGMVIQADRKKEMDRLETIYQTKEKEKEIELSKTIIQNKEKAIWIISIISSVLLILAFWLLWLRYKLHLSNKKLNILVNQKEDLVKEIHHRVKNNLQVISSLLNMHVRRVQDPESKKIFDDGVSRIQAMSIIHQNIYNHNQSLEQKPIEYIEKLIQQLYITYQIPEKSIQINTQIEDINLDIEKLMSLGLILNELLSNAFKYAFINSSNGVIDIKLEKSIDGTLNLLVKDNGIGINSNFQNSNESLGMRLIQAFSNKLNGKIIFKNDNGTLFLLNFNPN